MSSGTILDDIVSHKVSEIESAKSRLTLSQLKSQPRRNDHRGFAEAISRSKPAVIAEIKKASPSKGVIRADFNPIEIATSYQQHGATCLSVLTDSDYFQGCHQALVDARESVDVPVLRKDFIVDEYQVFETNHMGADCMLLIVAILDDKQLNEYHTLASELGLDVLVEVHNESELERAMQVEPKLVGINNRNLHTFETSIEVSIQLARQIPENVQIVSESGIHNREDIKRIVDSGVYAFLVGEAFMRETDPGEALARLFRADRTKSVSNS